MVAITFAIGGAVLLLLLGSQHAERNNYKSHIDNLNNRLQELEAARQVEQERYLQEVESKNREIERQRKNSQMKKIVASISIGAAIKIATGDPIITGVIMSIVYTVTGNNNEG